MLLDPQIPSLYNYIQRICFVNKIINRNFHRFWRASIAFFHCKALCFTSSKDITFFGWNKKKKKKQTVNIGFLCKKNTYIYLRNSETYRTNLEIRRIYDLNAKVIWIVRPYYVPFHYQLWRINVYQLWFVGQNKLYFFVR